VVEPDPLPDEAFVVRAGLMESKQLRLNAEAHHIEKLAEDGSDEWALSVFSVPELEADEIAMGAPFPNKQMRITTVGVLRAAGYDVTPSPWEHPLHADLRFISEPTEDDFEALRAIFDPPRPNPRLAEDPNHG
jgi:hypothetical protein